MKQQWMLYKMVLAGKVNKGLVADLTDLGGKAVGLCGVDGKHDSSS